ncbi:unnamed protein product [Discosporangium mesarthrocarpum]
MTPSNRRLSKVGLSTTPEVHPPPSFWSTRPSKHQSTETVEDRPLSENRTGRVDASHPPSHEKETAKDARPDTCSRLHPSRARPAFHDVKRLVADGGMGRMVDKRRRRRPATSTINVDQQRITPAATPTRVRNRTGSPSRSRSRGGLSPALALFPDRRGGGWL